LAKKFKYSFIIPCYNEEDYIVRLLESLARLRFEVDEFEVVVVDNNCNDGTVERVWEYSFSSNLNLRIVHEYNRGVSKARNLGAIKSLGKYLIFLDADNVVHANFLSDLDKSVRDNFGAFFSIRTIPDCVSIRGGILFYLLEVIKKYSWRQFGKSVVRRDVFYSINGFNPNIKLGENVDFMVRARMWAKQKNQKFGHIRTPIYCSLRRFEKVGYIKILVPWFFAYCGIKTLPYETMDNLDV